ncbi:MAG TPA: hypothetical protein VF263_13495 [Longimicrobiaceae bacterium]
MRRSRINLYAALVVALGGALLTARPAAAGECSGPAGGRLCACTSGNGQVTCAGDTCGSDMESCWMENLE